MTFDDNTPLGDARAWLREQASDKGAPCPCCSQFTKIYRRALNSNMAMLLVGFCRSDSKQPESWVHASQHGDGTGDLAKLRYWKLIEHNDDRSGWWRITEAGRAFVRGEIAVPRHALVFDSRCLGLDDRSGSVTIYDALGEHFNYHVLMSDPAGAQPATGGDDRG